MKTNNHLHSYYRCYMHYMCICLHAFLPQLSLSHKHHIHTHTNTQFSASIVDRWQRLLWINTTRASLHFCVSGGLVGLFAIRKLRTNYYQMIIIYCWHLFLFPIAPANNFCNIPLRNLMRVYVCMDVLYIYRRVCTVLCDCSRDEIIYRTRPPQSLTSEPWGHSREHRPSSTRWWRGAPCCVWAPPTMWADGVGSTNMRAPTPTTAAAPCTSRPPPTWRWRRTVCWRALTPPGVPATTTPPATPRVSRALFTSSANPGG